MARTRKKGRAARETLITSGILILVAGALTAGIAVGVRQSWRRISNRPEFRVRPLDLRIENAWLRVDAFKKQLLQTDAEGVLDRSVSVFTPQLADQVARALARSPYVREVRSVTREFPNTLLVDMDIREPFALLKHESHLYCVDRDGVVLDPNVYQLHLTEEQFAELGPAALVPSTVGVPRAGKRWEDVPVLEGIAMVRLCREQFARSVPISQIEIENDQAAGGPAAMATLVLTGGQRVRWGRTPDSPPSPVEIRTPQKAEALLALTRQEGESLQRFRFIDVRWPQPICE
jgi:hypothetical protein